jgi:two-component system NtrC family sensor kinase
MVKDRLGKPYIRLPGSRSPEDFGTLSHLILSSANRGEPKADFLLEISGLLIDFSRCDTVSIIFSEGGQLSRCSASTGRDGAVVFDMLTVPAGIGHESSGEMSTLERLRQHVIRGVCDPSIRFFTSYGSFCTGDATQPVSLLSGAGNDVRSQELKLVGEFCSLALIPSEVAKERIGLLELQSKRFNHFTKQDIELYETVAQTLGLALVNQRIQAALRERVKELTCLYGIATLSKKPEIPLEQILQEIVDILPPAWQYPKIAHGRIVFDDREFRSSGYAEGEDAQVADIIVEGKKLGFVEVVYAEPKPVLDEGPFLREERNLINAVALQIALIVEQREADQKRLNLQQQLRHSDRLATIGQLVAGVAHELNEPLSTILGFAQLAKKSPQLAVQISQDIHKIVNAALHAREIVKKLMLFSRQTPPRKTQVELNKLIEEGLYFLESRCVRLGIEVKHFLAPDLPEITADPSQLYQVLINLSVNAIQAMPNGGTLTVRTKLTDECVSLVVEDTGAGMSREVVEKIFIPFFTTKDVNEGTGLGLSVVHGIVTSHGGTIKVQSEVGKGSRFAVMLPVIGAEESEKSKRND